MVALPSSKGGGVPVGRLVKIIVGDVGRILATFVIGEQLIKADLEAGDIEDVGEVYHSKEG